MVSPLSSGYLNNWTAAYLSSTTSGRGLSQLSATYSVAQQSLAINSWKRQQPSLMTKALVALTGNANRLWQASKPFQPTTQDNVFLQRSATSTTPSAVTAKAQAGATLTNYSVSVTQIAAAQQNVGTALTSSATTSLAAATYTFKVQTNGVAYATSFAVNSGDTNQTVLDKMAQAINAAGAGVAATVVNGTSVGTSKLQVTANNTGTANAFTITDMTGTAVASTGVSSASTLAADANYTVNGTNYTSGSNTVYLENSKVTMTIAAVTNNATVTVSNDTQVVSTAVNSFVSAYNNMVSFTAENQQYIKPQVASSLNKSFTSQMSALRSIGITQNPDQTLAVDQSKLNSALQNNFKSVQAAFSGLDSIATNAGAQSRSIAVSPLNSYASQPPLANDTAPVLYSYLGSLNQSSLLSAFLSTGQLINMYR
ncbi:MAG TPA: flagellar filament capping protein FliD [Candidatus Aquicultor sp.]